MVTSKSDNPFDIGYPSVIWLDPGKTTGWAKLANYERSNPVFYSGEADFKETGAIIEAHAIADSYRTLIGVERTDITSMSSRSDDIRWAIEVTGVARWFCMEYPEMNTFLDPAPRSMRNVATVGMIKAIGWHKPGLEHALQASRHLLAWLIREQRLTENASDVVKKYLRSGPA